MPKALSAIAKLLRVRRIPFLGLTKTGLDDSDGGMIAAALQDAPPRVFMEPERLDLTQIDFDTPRHWPGMPSHRRPPAARSTLKYALYSPAVRERTPGTQARGRTHAARPPARPPARRPRMRSRMRMHWRARAHGAGAWR